MTDDEIPVENWIYCGKWVSQGRLRDRWQDPTGRDLIYSKVSAQVVGGVYRVKVSRKDDQNITVHGAPVWSGERIDDSQKLTALVKDDVAQRVIHTQLRKELKAGEEDPLALALAPLKKYARACRTGQEKDALIATIIRRLTDAW